MPYENPLSNFMRNAKGKEREEVFLEAARQATEKQMKIISTFQNGTNSTIDMKELADIKVTKESLPTIKQALIEYEKHSREHFELETKMLAGYMAVLNTLEEELDKV